MKKRILAGILSGIVFLFSALPGMAAEAPSAVGGHVAASGDLNLDAKGALLMEAKTGTILYEYQSEEKLYPASVTKVMTMLLVMEAIQEGTVSEEDTVTASANACSYGGTQIYLEPGEQMSLGDLLKAVAVNSANDAATALAEHIAGSEIAFVDKMNERAAQLGAKNTNFKNPCGLPHDDHYTCAYDVALFTRELLKHPRILDYTQIWTDSLRNGGFGLANTNKLLKTYNGITGMKTGYTEAAGHCLSATAERDGMGLIAVILGGETSKGRFASAASLLDYGFAGYTLVEKNVGHIGDLPVERGKRESVPVAADGELCLVVKKNKVNQVTLQLDLEESLTAPVAAGQKVGAARFVYEGETVLEVPVIAKETVEKCGFFDYLILFIQGLI